mmetsp:Transcript_16130/g.56250  ORF Transcript_16130/g.56250 Transcript_16130/m.56250 type:complete len:1121 (-) Transcript_16130:531-3893(-)
MDLAKRQGGELARVLETISGSDQLKDEYMRLSRELELAQERARMHFQHRREAENAVSLLEKQRAEVEKYQTLRKERARLGTEAVLFKLYAVNTEETSLRVEASTLKTELSAAEGQLKAVRGKNDGLDVHRQRVEAEIDKASSAHYVLKSNLDQIRPEIANCIKQAAHWGKKMEETSARMGAEEVRLRGMEGEVERARERRAEAEGELGRLRGQKVKPLVQMTEAQRAEFAQALAKCDAVGGRARERILDIEEQIAHAGRELASDRLDLDELQEKSTRVVARLEELSQDKENLRMETDIESSALHQKSRLEASIRQDLEKFRSFKDSLIDEQRAIRFMLDAAKGRRERLVLIEARQRIADELRERFPEGIIGRISELILPSQRRFELALQMSFGNLANAFIVTESAVGRECVRYLKSKKIACETFLPLDRIQPLKVGPLHLLTQSSQVRRMAAACAQHNEKFFERNPRWQAEGPGHVDSALEFLLSGTIVVDDFEEATRTSFQDARPRKLTPRVVTLQGEVIAPNGNMSVEGGNVLATSHVEFGGTEELQEIQQQAAKLECVDKDLATLSEQIALKARQASDLERERRLLEERAAAAGRRLRSSDATRASEQELLSSLHARADELKAKTERTIANLNEIERAKETLEADLLKVGKRHFAKLNEELGVQDIREVVHQEQRLRRKWRESVKEQEEKVRCLVAEAQNIESAARGGAKMEAFRRDCEQYKRDIEDSRERQAKLEVQEASRAKRVEASSVKIHDLRQQQEQVESDLKANRTEASRIKSEVDLIRKNVKRLSDKLRLLLSIKCIVFRESHEKQIDVPLLGGPQEDLLEGSLFQERDLDAWSLQDLEEAGARLQVDFAELQEERREAAARTKVNDTKIMDVEYEARVAALTRELQTLSPNMRAIEEFAVEAAKLREIRKSADEVTLESQKLAREFEAVKLERCARFNKCYKHVEAQVQPFYRSLTSYDGHEGGSAYLDLDDAEEPYNGGITFTACPPGKRFFPMELLSGGEKSMASLSLLFAMHSFMPPPFMILDEVDAPFDRKNTDSLVRCLKKMDFQCLVISLKDSFFAHSDSIVGIYKDKALQCSGCLSLPLQRLGAQSANPGAFALADMSEDED